MLRPITFLAAALFLSSCKEKAASSEVVEFEAEKLKLEELQQELAKVQIKAREAKTDAPTVPVADLEKKLAAAKDELETLNGKFGELEKSYQEVTKKLEDYQKKYPLR